MANPRVYTGLKSLNDSELSDLKSAVEAEFNERRQRIRGNNLAVDLDSLMANILGEGFCIIIETDEDEIEIMSEKAKQLEVTVYPAINPGI